MQVIHNNKDITQYVSTMTWSGSKSEVARKLELSILNAPLDKNITPVTLKLADPVYLMDDDGKELFRGFITDREPSSKAGTVSYTAYDLLYYTLKSKATYNIKNKTAEAITKMVCKDLEIPTGSLASTNIKQKLLAQDKTIYEIIMMAYTKAHNQNEKSYIAKAVKGKLTVAEIGATICKTELSEESNITSSKYKESLSNMVNRVKIYDSEGTQKGVVEKESYLKYGIFQSTYTKEDGVDSKKAAKSLFNGVEKTFTFECLNYNDAITGNGAMITDKVTGIKGLVWIDSDTHKWTNGVATMTLTVTLKKVMDEKEADSTTSSSSSSSGSSSSSSSGSAFGDTLDSSKLKTNKLKQAGSKDNTPIYIVDKNSKNLKKFSAYNDALAYYTSENGYSSGWNITDADKKVIEV